MLLITSYANDWTFEQVVDHVKRDQGVAVISLCETSNVNIAALKRRKRREGLGVGGVGKNTLILMHSALAGFQSQC